MISFVLNHRGNTSLTICAVDLSSTVESSRVDENLIVTITCTTIYRYPIFSTKYSVMCKVYTGYCGTSER